ncbi:GNAT family N-acetyltransferase [Aliiroseovarius sp. S1339]|uniref:GNAT family N-acetyltransferase n=1 Tax=Aliiroseovarius sp. S1339 TaxID=2936990 RepID=UPI0020C07569|nr:GNAT family N-acetyltransferase [Aliiroseovarius sp. S1339]MCK8465035.1 GNAT family N-acetyltransferase [Aliiroseovarius sp. S1339]
MSVTIETPHLLLRQPEMGDWEAIAAFLGSDRAQFIGGPYTRRTAWRAFGHMVGHWTLRGFGIFVGVEKTSGAPVCSVGPWYPEGWPEHEISWSVWTTEAEGKGFAYEAASIARDWAYSALGWTTAVSYVDEANVRSAALAQRLGCVIDPTAPRFDDDAETGIDRPYHVWRHPAPDTDGTPEAYA